MAREQVKRVVLEGKAKTAAISRKLKDVRRGTQATGKSAAQASGKYRKMAGSLNRAGSEANKAKESLKKFGRGLGIAVAAVGAGVFAIDRMAERAIELNNVLGSNSLNLDIAARAVDNMTTKFELATAANRLANAELELTSTQYGELTGVIAKAADVTGTDLDQAIKRVTQSIAAGRVTGVSFLGIRADQAELESHYAAELGKTRQELSLNEKRQAAFNEVLRQGRIIQDEYNESLNSNAHEWARGKNTLKDWIDQGIIAFSQIKIGQENVGDAGVAAAKFRDALQGVNEVVEKTHKEFRVQGRASRELDNEIIQVQQTVEALNETWERDLELIKPLRHFTENEYIAAVQKQVQKLQELRSEVHKLTGDSRELTDALVTQSQAMGLTTTEGGATFGSSMAQFQVQQKAMRKFRRDLREAGGDSFEFSGADTEESKKKKTEEDPRALDRGIESQGGIMRDLAKQRVEVQKQRQKEELARTAEFERTKANIQLQERLRAIESMQSAGVDPIQRIEAEKQARLEFLQGELERAEQIEDTDRRAIESMQIRDQIEATKHDARIARLKEEKSQLKESQEAMKDRAQFAAQMSGEVSAAFGEAAVAAVKSADRSGEAFMRSIKGWATSKAIQMSILAISEAAQGIAKAASPFTAAEAPGHFAAAAKATAAATAIGALAGVATAVTGGFSSSQKVREPELGPTVDERGVPSGTRASGQPGQGAAAQSRAPTGSSVPPPSPQQSGMSKNVNVTVQGNLVAGSEEELGLKIRQLIEESDRGLGKVAV